MENQLIINKVNELTKSNFTKIIKARKNAGACFLIVALSCGASIYGAYNSKAVYYIDSNNNPYSFR